ncbi:hypothetical protein CROSSROADS_133 [Mycobacterium phage Crossroads]|uniref:hypothetical protein n=1 Tax=Mycobacterium phage Crossroads TaxID=1340836 RepID=UPI0003881F80|nr:hypothetical protein N848_gp120 [Mycobacterium phage Crossroads]AGT13119.1 hypothetical protein CROSSROADS_133 [Mycobacterium phage Crossroads]
MPCTVSDMSNDSYRALVLRPDGTRETVTIPRDHSELRTLQGIVGGYIEGVYGWTSEDAEAFDVTFMVHSEGKLLNQPVNVQATALWWSFNPGARGVDRLRGVVVVTGGADGEGNTLAVPNQVVEVVERAGE